MNIRNDNNETDRTSLPYVKNETKRNCHDLLEMEGSMKMSRQDNDMIDHTSPLYAEKEIELTWLIWQNMEYDEV